MKTESAKTSKLRAELMGVLLPITTPFQTDGAVDFTGLRSNIEKWNQTGVSGYAVLGSTGERVNLDESEQLKVLATAREVVPADKLFIAGAGQQSTIGTIKEIRRVGSAVSPDAVLVITPHFYRSAINQDALVNYYQRIADESPVPLVLYSMPALTGIKIEPETAARLSEHENIIGLKDSSNDIEGLRKTVRLSRKEFVVLGGNGTVFFQALEAGAAGGVLAVGCTAPELCLAVFFGAKGEREVSLKLQSALAPLAEAVTTRFGIGGLKAAMDMSGFTGGAVREPLRSPDNEAREEIQRLLDEAIRAWQATSQLLSSRSHEVSTTPR